MQKIKEGFVIVIIVLWSKYFHICFNPPFESISPCIIFHIVSIEVNNNWNFYIFHSFLNFKKCYFKASNKKKRRSQENIAIYMIKTIVFHLIDFHSFNYKYSSHARNNAGNYTMLENNKKNFATILSACFAFK